MNVESFKQIKKMEYDVTIVECITIEKLKYYYTKKQLVKKINSNLKELCKK